MQIYYIFIIFINIILESCIIAENSQCKETTKSEKWKGYSQEWNEILIKIDEAEKNYVPCAKEALDPKCQCHASIIDKDLLPYKAQGISKKMINDSAKFGTQYKIYNNRLYRDEYCMFPARCSGIEYFLLKLLSILPNVDLVINTRDWPQIASRNHAKHVVLSFSKTNDYNDIMYPAWSFWAGGPAISGHPTGIGRWDEHHRQILSVKKNLLWNTKITKGFFRGSRTSDERDTLVLLSRRNPNLVDAQYTKNQAWKSPKDTLNAEPAEEVSFQDHCKYKYLFNFRGVAASFRFKHLFLCQSLVFHVGDEWNEFFYFGLKPWVHYVPLKSYPSEEDLEDILKFFIEHDSLALKIAKSGTQFIAKHLRMSDVVCYWEKLINRYHKLLRYEVVQNNDLIKIMN